MSAGTGHRRTGWAWTHRIAFMACVGFAATAVAAAAHAGEPTGCSTDSTLCLQDGRFLVEATWKKSDGSAGMGHPVNLSADSGYFWFLEPDNVELVVKTLNGCSVNGHHSWFFADDPNQSGTNPELPMETASPQTEMLGIENPHLGAAGT